MAYARWAANASTAWRERRDAGADVPTLRTFQEGMARALTPGQRAGLRAGERARRELDAYLRWEPEARNDLWEADHKQLDIDVLAGGFERPVRPWLTLFVEAYSRVVPGWAVSVRPHSGSILASIIQRSRSSGTVRMGVASRSPTPFTVRHAQVSTIGRSPTLSTCAPSRQLVPPTPPTESVPATERSR